MADAFFGEIRIFAGNFAPRSWAFCNGQLIPIAQNTALFSILGIQYGGDGKTNFALPNLQAKAPMFWGQGPGLTEREIGETGGSPTVSLLTTEIPAHAHSLQGKNSPANLTAPAGNTVLGAVAPTSQLYASKTADVALSPVALNVTGASQPHNNMQPFVALSFIIALQGEFPSRG